MKCPVDETVLQMAERHGVEIDYCPECRGTWLDHGELDRIIDREIQAETGHATHDVGRPEGAHAAKKKSRFSFVSDLLAGGGED